MQLQSVQSVIDYMRSLDFFPNDITPDGKIHRFKRTNQSTKENAWYVGWQNPRLDSGEFYTVVVFGDWKTAERHIVKPSGLSRTESRMIDDQIKEKQEKLKKEVETFHSETAVEAGRRYLAATKVGVTPYMTRKSIPELYGCCIYLDRLQIPLRDVDGKIWNMQTVFPNGDKRYMTNGKTEGLFHVLGAPLELSSEVNLCEGISTATSIYQATGKTTVTCCSYTNLPKVAKALRARYPATSFTVCGDDDRKHEKGNPGREGASKAGMICDGAVVFPKFRADDTESSDFNDVHLKYGLEELKNQLLEQPMEQTSGFVPLGYDESTHFFFDTVSKDIVKANSFSPIQLYNIAPLDYWETRYPGHKGGADLNKAAHDLVRQSRLIGPFSSQRVRGTGVWMDDNRVVVNTGHSLIVGGKEISLVGLKSEFFYVQTVNRIPPLHHSPLALTEVMPLVKAISNLNWRQSDKNGNLKPAMLLLGWLVCARVAGALPVRPHVWLTGGKGTGKSTVMENIIANALGAGKIYAQGGSTEAGIRQSVKSDAQPILFDEFETNGQNRERIGSIIELFRQAWSASQGGILKGSASGLAVQYKMAFCALVSSIRVGLENDADISRFSVLELHKTDPKRWPEMQKHLALITNEFGERFFSRNVNQIPNILMNYEIFQPVLASQHGSRFGQQNGMLLSGAYTTCSDEPVTKEIAEKIVDSMNWDEEANEARETDEMDCLNHLLGQRIKFDGGEQWCENNVGGILDNRDGHGLRGLKDYGMMCDEAFFFVANKHSQLAKFFERTRWVDWKKSLQRLPGATPTSTVNFSGVRSRAVKIPLSTLNSAQ